MSMQLSHCRDCKRSHYPKVLERRSKDGKELIDLFHPVYPPSPFDILSSAPLLREQRPPSRLSTLEQLPPEIILEIFSHLTCGALDACRMLCRSWWQNITTDPSLVRHVVDPTQWASGVPQNIPQDVVRYWAASLDTHRHLPVRLMRMRHRWRAHYRQCDVFFSLPTPSRTSNRLATSDGALRAVSSDVSIDGQLIGILVKGQRRGSDSKKAKYTMYVYHICCHVGQPSLMAMTPCPTDLGIPLTFRFRKLDQDVLIEVCFSQSEGHIRHKNIALPLTITHSIHCLTGEPRRMSRPCFIPELRRSPSLASLNISRCQSSCMDWQEDYGSTSSEDTPFIQTNLGIDSWLFLEKILTIDSHNRREFRPATYFLALNRSENAVFLVRCTERPAVLDGETLARGGGHTCDITPLVKFPAPSQHSSFRNISFCTPFRRITLQHQFEPLRIALLWRDYRHVSSARNVLFIHALDPPLWYSYRLTHRATSSTPPPTRWESEFWENLLDLSPQRLYSGGDTAPFAPLPGLDPILTLPGKRISSFPSTMGGMHLHLTNLDTGLADDSPSLPSAGIRLHRFPDSPRLPHVKCLLWGPSPSTPIPPDTPPPALTLTTIFLSNHILPSPIEHHVQSHMPFTPHATRDDFCGCALHDYAYRVVLPRVRSRWASSLSSALNPRSWFRAASRASILPSTKAEAEEGVSYRDLPAREQALRRRDEAARELVADPERWGFVAVEEV